MDGQHIFPGELAILIAFMFAPPLLFAFTIQSWFLVTRGAPAVGRFAKLLLAYSLTTIGSLVIGVLFHSFAPRSLGPVLGVKDVSIAGQSWTVMPLAFIAVAIVTPVVTWWVARRTTNKA